MEEDIKIKDTGADDVHIKQVPGEIKPPLEEGAEKEEEVVAKKITGKIPISPAIIKPPLRLEGMVLSETTGFPGWMYTEEDLDEIANLIAECGWELTPQIQVVVALAGLHGAKFAAYVAWRKGGRKGDLRKHTGQVPETARPGEEVKA